MIGLVAILGVGVLLGRVGHATPFTQSVGDVCNLLSTPLTCLACARAARRRTRASRGWLILAIAMGLFTVGEVVYTTYGFARGHQYPFPSAADVFFLGYVVPAVAALFAFTQPPALLISRFRALLDVVVITLSLLMLSWAIVLHQVLATSSPRTLAGFTSLMYPIVDLTICSVVLALGMRQPPGERLLWVLLGGGLLTLAVTDTLFVRLLAQGQTGLTGTPLTTGWLTAFLLISLATLTVERSEQDDARRGSAAMLELLPYVPVIAAFIVFSVGHVPDGRFSLWCGGLLVLAVVLRQVLIVYENTQIRDLQERVVAGWAERQRLASVVMSSRDAIVAVALDTTVLSWNPAAELLFGESADDVVGRPLTLLSAADMAVLNENLSGAAQGDAPGLRRVQWTRKDGRAIPLSLTVSALSDDETILGISIIAKDDSERIEAERALVAARAEALEGSRMKSEFLATMSHEIRTPMNGVIGLTGLLLDTALNDVQLRYAQGVKSAGEALLVVINDILDFSKLEAGKVHLEIIDFDPRRLADEVGALLAAQADSKGLELMVRISPDTPPALRGDMNRIRQILLNLAGNAVKFTSSGEVEMRLDVSSSDEDQVVLARFQVSDTGIGIAEADQERLFESFSQADATTTRRFGGTGLGLAISLRLVEAMGGKMGVTSELGAGSSFWFRIPLTIGRPVAANSPNPPEALRGLHALVVDDNATNRVIVAAQLEAWRVQPDLVVDAPSALVRLRKAAGRARPYDFVVLDMCMPDMDGLQLAEAINTDPVLTGTPLIMLTSAVQLDPPAMRAAGIGRWLAKPVRSSELYDRLCELMDRQPPSTAPRAEGPGVDRPRGEKPSRQILGRVLVVEDNELNQLVAEGVLAQLGYLVDVVANGVEALVAMSDIRYAAVLMDCHMPVMDGYEATREFRLRQGSGARTPIIAMTAGAMAEDRGRALAAGMDDYITKPIVVEELARLLTQWVRRPLDGFIAPVHPRPVGDDSEPESGGPAPGEPFKDDLQPDDLMPAELVPVELAADQAVPVEPRPTRQLLDEQRLDSLRQLGALKGVDLLSIMVELFERDSAIDLAAMVQAVSADTRRPLREAAHKLRGSAANLGAERVTALCLRLEIEADELTTAEARVLLEQLSTELHHALDALTVPAVRVGLDH